MEKLKIIDLVNPFLKTENFYLIQFSKPYQWQSELDILSI